MIPWSIRYALNRLWGKLMVDENANAKIAFDYFSPVNMLGPIGACGILAQIQGESSFDPSAIGDRDSAFGICQWHADRIALIKAGCGIDIHALPDFATQCEAIWFELNSSERAALAAIKAATTPYDAGSVAETTYERSGTSGDPEKRGNFAVAWAKTFGVSAV